MKRLLRDRSARFGLIIIAALVLCAVFAGFVFILTNLAVDIAQTLLDPRGR